jgi:hypothetical protein
LIIDIIGCKDQIENVQIIDRCIQNKRDAYTLPISSKTAENDLITSCKQTSEVVFIVFIGCWTKEVWSSTM